MGPAEMTEAVAESTEGMEVALPNETERTFGHLASVIGMGKPTR